MNYHVNHPNQRIHEMAKSNERDRILNNDLKAIREIHYEVVSDFYEYLSEGTKWFPKSLQTSKNLLSLEIPDRDGNPNQTSLYS